MYTNHKSVTRFIYRLTLVGRFIITKLKLFDNRHSLSVAEQTYDKRRKESTIINLIETEVEAKDTCAQNSKLE